MREIQAVIFDIGNVIIRWQPYEALKHLFSDELEMQAKLADVGFQEWNLEQDRGRDWQEGLQLVTDTKPHESYIFEAYVDGLEVAHKNQMPEVSDIIADLIQRNIPVFGLSNAAENSFQFMRQTAPIINSFRHTTVSARVGMIKPNADIFEHCLGVNNLDANSALFIDDSAANCAAASALGIVAHQFVGVEPLKAALRTYGLIESC